jgi:PIN domain nuclease of toxin-antitoxin system
VTCLLDTCTFLWWSLSPDQLTEKVLEIIGNQRNDIYISSATCWEIVIKYNINRLEIPTAPDNFILEEVRENSFSMLSINPSHIFELQNLPNIHNDPFDRILVAQAKNDRLSLLTNDNHIGKYNVDIVW